MPPLRAVHFRVRLRLLTLPVEGVPCAEPSRQASCVRCGHCAAVRPGGIMLDGIAHTLEAVGSPLSEALAARPLKARRAIWNFQASDIGDALLEKTFSLAAYAPTARNARQVSCTVINGRSKVEKLLRTTVRLMGEHNIYPGHTRSAAAMIRCFAGLLASFSYMPRTDTF